MIGELLLNAHLQWQHLPHQRWALSTCQNDCCCCSSLSWRYQTLQAEDLPARKSSGTRNKGHWDAGREWECERERAIEEWGRLRRKEGKWSRVEREKAIEVEWGRLRRKEGKWGRVEREKREEKVRMAKIFIFFSYMGDSFHEKLFWLTISPLFFSFSANGTEVRMASEAPFWRVHTMARQVFGPTILRSWIHNLTFRLVHPQVFSFWKTKPLPW